MPSFIRIPENSRWNAPFRFISGKSRRTVDGRETDNGLRFVYYYTNDIFINVINISFFLLFILSAVSFFIIASLGIYEYIYIGWGDPAKIIKGIELIFISPLPLLIVTAFHGYYKNIIIPIVQNKNLPSSLSDFLRMQQSDTKNKLSSLVDIGIIKYLFVSILLSTLFVFILGKILEVSEGYKIHRSDQKLVLETTSKDSNAVQVVIIDQGKASTILIDHNEFEKLNAYSKEDINKSVKYDLFWITVSILSIILLIIYLRVISKNLGEDIESSIKFNYAGPEAEN